MTPGIESLGVVDVVGLVSFLIVSIVFITRIGRDRGWW